MRKFSCKDICRQANGLVPGVIVLLATAFPTRAGDLFHHHKDDPSTRTRGAWLDPGLPPGQPGYYGIGPGHQAGACSRPGCLGGFGSTTKLLNGLHHRYPWFCGYIPAPPRQRMPLPDRCHAVAERLIYPHYMKLRYFFSRRRWWTADFYPGVHLRRRGRAR